MCFVAKQSNMDIALYGLKESKTCTCPRVINLLKQVKKAQSKKYKPTPYKGQLETSLIKEDPYYTEEYEAVIHWRDVEMEIN